MASEQKSKSEDVIVNEKKVDRSKARADYHDTFSASIERNQINISRFILLSVYVLHFAYPPARRFTSRFISLQYRIGTDATNQPVYDIGIDDVYYVINWVLTLTFLRASLMQWCFGPFASRFCNITSKRGKVRFAEQSWSFAYGSFSFIFGAYLYIKSPYYLNMDHVYLGWPHYRLSPAFKAYYLISTAFWLQQVFVLNIEERRKDHYQMFGHHIITCLLIIGSYYYYFIRIGHLILMIMDSVDALLCSAKMLKYAGFTTLCDVMFLLFLISWTVLRHGLYNYVFYFSWSKAKLLTASQRCIPGIVQKRCWTPKVYDTFFALLGVLQILTIIWMVLILKVAYKVVTGKGAEDVRSDDGSEDESEDEETMDTTSSDTQSSEDTFKEN